MEKKKNSRFGAYGTIIFIVLILYTLSLFLPSFWAFLTSFKGNIAYLSDPLGFPKVWKWENIRVALDYYVVQVNAGGNITDIYIELMFLYSILYAVGSAFASAFVACITAYVTARFDFKFNKVIYAVVIVTMTLPIVGSLPSELQLLKALGLYNHIFGLWICKANFLGMYYLVFFAAFKSVPKDYFEAAYIDGASQLTVMFRIAFPLVRNTFLTIMLIKFVEFWNDYTVTITYMPSIPTVAFGLYEYSVSAKPAINNTPMRLAGCYILIVPVLAVFLIFRNRLMDNISMGGIKE